MTAMRPFDSADAKLFRGIQGRTKRLEASEHYAPYPVDWRFLPPEGQILIDFTHHYLSDLSNAIATRSALSRLWAATLGRSTISSISRAGVLFIHVPKSGGTSISQRLYGRNLPHYPASFYRAVFPKETTALPSFAVIRHPVERLVSAYAFLRHWGTEVMACDRYDRHVMGDMASIDAVVDRLHGEGARLTFLPDAFRSQCSYVLDDQGDLIVDRLFSLDRATGFSSELGHWLDCSNLPHINTTGSENITISEESRRKVGEIYSRDFALYQALVANGGHLEVEDARLRLAS
jgi:hypothetical protein